jgi:hypothetical protein
MNRGSERFEEAKEGGGGVIHHVASAGLGSSRKHGGHLTPDSL